MNLSKLKLTERRKITPSQSTEKHLKEVREFKEVKNLRETNHYNWRKLLEKEGHPYVEVNPGGETKEYYKKAQKKSKDNEESINKESIK